ncbi:1,6-anhydro-N-acetylmuramyl-L-alanine amidase AmpD [Ferrimonas sediminicola]|uniref:1,6-anhydro-N-acetylmuramyl-L-alanine amidase AmpD n=1 Tax=Ferrimonas sediminicola TaxID=2569538 RepID=A0A4U1BK96_9GAMM|nr:1,6-anhydro-N-acetylmuramyl-L-alanine amidase AmpD [Ferrimonas sediminicola]TKB51625.1 1,6-anhydro-N-acetylmuramyl-L-alanine amidase AmpD [Ferrimonas sediminicola]
MDKGNHHSLEPRGRWLHRSIHRFSPFQDARPDGVRIDALVIHNISLLPGQFGSDYVDQLFLGCIQVDHPLLQQVRGLRVSAHLLIRRDGSVVQYVPFDRRAWHAGVSELAGRHRCNDFSIGIEMEGSDHCPFTMAQYHSLIEVTLSLLESYPDITLDRIVGHSDIAPGRKSDPGPYFDWDLYRQELNKAR